MPALRLSHFTMPSRTIHPQAPLIAMYSTSTHADKVTQVASAVSQKAAELTSAYTVHDVAKSGFSTGTNDFYDSARPSYPSAAIQAVHKTLISSAHGPLKLIEAGAGTGIFSRLLLRPPAPVYPSFDIDTLVSVEPSEGMRETWRKSLTKAGLGSKGDGKQVGVVDGAFDALHRVQEYGITKAEEEGGGVDGVLIAQAFHWCPNHEAALREIASYLRQGAPLILIWNLESMTPEWQGRLRHLYQPYDLGSPQYYKGLWRKMFDTVAYKELFQDKQEEKVTWSGEITEDGLVERLLSKSYLTEKNLKGEPREKFVQEVRKIVKDGNHEWVDQDKGIFKYQYDTDIVVCRRK